jgi:hypothetical protein
MVAGGFLPLPEASKHPSFVWRIPVVNCMNVEIFGDAKQEQRAGDMN